MEKYSTDVLAVFTQRGGRGWREKALWGPLVFDVDILIDRVLRRGSGWEEGLQQRPQKSGAAAGPSYHDQRRDYPHFARETLIVVYRLGPGCNGATTAAWKVSRLGFAVKEMIGHRNHSIASTQHVADIKW
jgi:hypothetical protein